MSELTFYMQVYLEPDHGLETATELRTRFPEAHLIVYCDGGPDKGELLDPLDVEYIHSRERTFLQGCLSPHLMLERFLERPTRHLIKLDADTAVHRRFRKPLPTDCVFGSLQFVGQPDESVQGGCMGFPAEVAETLHRSEVLLDERLHREAPPTSDPYLVHLAYRWRERGVGSFDWSIAWGCRRLGIPMREFDEIRALWQRKPTFRPGEYALTHPRTDKAEIQDQPNAVEIRQQLVDAASTANTG